MAQLLAEVDPDTLSEGEVVAYAQAVQRQQSWTDSLLLSATRRFAEQRPGPAPHEESLLPGTEHRVYLGGELSPGVGSFAVAEWAVGLRITRTAAQRLIADALDLTHRLSGVAMAARIGHTDTARARMVATLTRELPAEQVRARREVYIEHTDDDHAEISGTLDATAAVLLDQRLPSR